MRYENLNDGRKKIMDLIKNKIEEAKSENGELDNNAIPLSTKHIAYLFSEISKCDYDTLNYLDLSNFDFSVLNEKDLGDGMKQKIVSMMQEDSLNDEKKYPNLYLDWDVSVAMMPELLKSDVDFYPYVDVNEAFTERVLLNIFNIVKENKDSLKEGERIQFNSAVLNHLVTEFTDNYFNLSREDRSMLRYIDLSEVCFDNRKVSERDYSNCNAKIDPQKVKNKNLYRTNLKNVDMHLYDFTDVEVERANLEGTGANIDPQRVKNKSLYNTNLAGLNLSDKEFDGVGVVGANLEGTGANIDPQTVFTKDLRLTRLKGLNLRDKDFTGVRIDGADLEGTGAKINPQTVIWYDETNTNLAGTVILNLDFPCIYKNTKFNDTLVPSDEIDKLCNEVAAIKVYKKNNK